MLVYKDMTFCVNEKCNKRCKKYLTCEIEKAAKDYGLPLAVASFICLDCGEDGVYRLEGEEVEEMSEMPKGAA